MGSGCIMECLMPLLPVVPFLLPGKGLFADKPKLDIYHLARQWLCDDHWKAALTPHVSVKMLSVRG